MNRITYYMAGTALACALAFSATPAFAQLLPDLGGGDDVLGGVTESLGPVGDVVESVLDPVIDTVEPVVETVVGDNAPLNDVVSVDITPSNEVDVTLLGGTDPTDIPLGDLGLGLPDVGVNLPEVADITDPTDPVIPVVPDLPDITVIEGDDGDTINNNPNIIISNTDPNDDPAPLPDPNDDDPRVIIINNPGTNTNTHTIGTSSTHTTVSSISRGSSANQGIVGRKGKLGMLMAVLQNRGWMRFVAGNGVCLPPFATTSVRDMLSRRDERRLNDVLATYSNDIATMRQMLANCRSGPRLQANDINRVIGVGISQNGTPVLYVL